MKKFFVILFALLILPVLAAESPFENLSQYFEYLPNAVHKNWAPYKADKDYEVTVQFRVKKNGEITEPSIVNSTEERANKSVIDAVKSGAPYLPLPSKFPGESVNTQVQLKYLHSSETPQV